MMNKKLLYGGLAIVVAAALSGLLYYVIEVKEWLSEEAVSAFLADYRADSWAPLFVIGAYILAGLTFFPATILSLAVAAVFGPIKGIVYGLSGTLLSASLIFFIGQKLRGRKLNKFIHRHIHQYDRQLERSGIVGVTTLRLIVFAPFSLFNIVMGISSVRYTDFIVGTFLGLLPGFVARAIVGDSILPLIFQPTWQNVSYLMAGITLWVFIILLSRKLMGNAPTHTMA